MQPFLIVFIVVRPEVFMEPFMNFSQLNWRLKQMVVNSSTFSVKNGKATNIQKKTVIQRKMSLCRLVMNFAVTGVN